LPWPGLIISAETPADVVSFPAAVADGYSAVSEVKGDLELPEAKVRGKLPVVLVLHGSAGIDGRGEFHAKALNAAGIGTLETFMFSRGNRPGAGRNKNLTHVYGALKYLAGRPEIDPARVGVMGFSWGGGLSLTAASANITRLFMGGRSRFAAHAPFYPVCWSHLRTTSDPKASGYGRYKTLTGAPVLIFAGGEDDYDDSDTCQKFIASLGEEARSHVSLNIIPRPRTVGTFRSGRECSMRTRLRSVKEARSG
jgi:uncharacterized protein